MSLRRCLASAVCAVGIARAVVIIPGGEPKPYKAPAVVVTTAEDVLRASASNEFTNNSARILLSTYTNSNANLTSPLGTLLPSGDGFVRGAIQAWGEHLHLVLRPEEVWFTILVQLNFYMNAHAEDVRDLFVTHSGQELIYIEDVTWYAVLRRFRDEIQARVKTDWLRDWITPNFTTTTENDVMTSNVLMMGLTKAYFKFEGGIICGLPSVTLLGEKADWASLLARLDHLRDFGVEPTAYAQRLRPIISRFVSSFDDPDGRGTRDFWNSIATARRTIICGGPPLYISGWITGFFYWNDQGKPYGRVDAAAAANRPAGSGALLQLDDVVYPELDITTLPVGYARAPFIMRDFNGTERFPAYVAAGTLGKQITQGAPPGFSEALGRVNGNPAWLDLAGDHGTLRPLSAWMLYGPVDYNATVQWRKEAELTDIANGAKQFFNGTTCGSTQMGLALPTSAAEE